mgnify:CR=1 FL=1
MQATNKVSLKIITAAIVLSTILLSSCNTSGDDSSSDFDSEWLIPSSQIVDGGPGKDGIPSLEDPDFIDLSEVTFIPDDRMVLGLRIGDEIRAYPHQILDWHEIVNDEVDGKSVALLFCPVTGTGMAWDRNINGTVTEFGVSGLLYKNNLIPYDRNTDSNWSQMLKQSVNGTLSGLHTSVYTVVETSWANWKELYPDSKVLSTNTGFSRNYSGFTYGPDYSTNNNRILFPIENDDNRLPRKERVLGVIDELENGSDSTVKAFPLADFGAGFSVIREQVGTTEYIIVGSSDRNISAAFLPQFNDGSFAEGTFTSLPNQLPAVMEDESGNLYDLFGYVVDGPDEGKHLAPANAYTGYWFGWADFFPDIEIYRPAD